MARGKIKTTEEQIEETRAKLKELEAKLDTEDFQKEVIALLKKCYDRPTLEKIYKLLGGQPKTEEE